MQVWETHRAPGRQQHLFTKGVTKARPWQSPHNHGLAADIVFDPKQVDLPTRPAGGKEWPDLWCRDREDLRELWRRYGESAKSHGLVWGGDWGPLDEHGLGWDLPHIELANWPNYKRQP